jgi:hypothetical protein
MYAGGAVFLIAFGLSARVWPGTSTAGIRGGLVFAGLGVLISLVAVFRIWQVARALRRGDAYVAEVVDAQVGPARIYGTPWGEPMGTRTRPLAATGTYRLITSGEAGRYYMHQRWATALKTGARIWVLRYNGRDVLYAPLG